MTLWTVAYQAPPSVGFFRQEYCSRLPFPSPRDLPNPGIKPGFPALEADTLTSEPPGKPTAFSKASLRVQLIKNPLAMQEPPVQFLGQEDPLEKGNPLQYSGLENPTDCIFHGVAKSWTRLSKFDFTSCILNRDDSTPKE